MIFDKYRAVCIQVPRTGSTFISNLLHDVSPAYGSKGYFSRMANYKLGPLSKFYGHLHIPYRDYEKDIKPYVDNYIVFSFVRHPYDRWVSIFFHPGPHVGIEWERSEGSDIGEIISNFRKFCQASTRHEDWIDKSGWKTQTDYLKNSTGEINLDFIGKLENIEADWKILTQKFSFPPYDISYKHTLMNSRPKIPLEDLYDQETKDIIFSYFKEDFVNFNYER